MKVEIKNRGPDNDEMLLVLEPAPDYNAVLLIISIMNYSSDEPYREQLAHIYVSAEQLKAAMDSLVKQCKKPKPVASRRY